MNLTSLIGIERGLANIPWKSWTPTITAGTGTFTTVLVPIAEYKKVGKLVFINLLVNIENQGSAGSDIRISPPPGLNPSTLFVGQCTGREARSVGYLLLVHMYWGDLVVYKHDYTFPGATGAGLVITGWYRMNA